MTEPQRALFAKADRMLDAARANLDRDDAETAVNRAYYAVYSATLAALLTLGETPRSHSGAHRRFALGFVETGRVPADVGRTLAEAFRARQRADYDAMAITDTRGAADLVTDAERFVHVVREVVEA